MITFAHRGARSELPENTLPAFRRALELGASGLESDAWVSSDGEVVLVHDEVVRRGLRRWRVPRAAAADLATVDIPRLADLYEELGTDFELSLDVKDPRAASPIVELARSHGAAERLWICSPSVRLLRGFRPEAPDVKLVHSRSRHEIGPLERHAAGLSSIGIDAMNLHHSEWSAGLVVLFHRFSLRAFAWDAQETRHLRAMLRYGVDAVYCDDVARMVAVVSEWGATADSA